MRSARSLPTYAASFALFGVFAAAAGCTEIFGFERSDLVVQCVHHADCGGPPLVCINNFCTPGCMTTDDCSGHPAYLDGLVCRENACVAKEDGGPPPRAAPDSSPDVAVDANEPDHEASTCGDTTSNVDHCGSCGNACAGRHAQWACVASTCVAVGCESGWSDCNADASDGCEQAQSDDASACGTCANTCRSTICDDMNVCAESLCLNGSCRPLSIPGLLATRENGGETLDGDSFYAFQVHVSPGWLTAFGIITDSLGAISDAGVPTVINPHGYLGLYGDINGQPGQLVAKAAGGQELAIAAGTRQLFPVASPVELTAPYYWIVAVFDQPAFLPNSPGQTKQTITPLNLDGSTLSPLPTTAPPPTFSCEPPADGCSTIPALYIVVAQ
jgi:hypothetical protein